MNILHLQLTGNPGGIVSLTRDFANNSNNNNIIYFIFQGGTVADAIMSDGHQVVVDDVKKIGWRKGAQNLNDFCRANGVDVIINHTNSPVGIYLTNYVVKRNKKIKWIMYFHSDPKDMSLKRKMLYYPFIKHQIKKADARIAISDYVKKSAADSYGIKEDKIDVVYNGVDISKFHSKNIKDSDTVNFIYVGRLFPQKGVHLLVDAISKISDEYNFRFSIVGRGPQQQELVEQAARLNVSEKIEFLGSRMDVPDLLKKADFFIHPAIWNEGFGITLVEAMSSGLPCVAFRKGAIPEIITNNKNGYIVDNVSVEDLAEVIKKCISIRNTNEYASMVDNAIKTAGNFDISNMVNKLEKIIER